MKKYNLELDEEQLSVVNEALEEYFRIRMGQWSGLADDLSSQNVDFHMENKEIHSRVFDRYIITRDCVREIFESVSRILREGLRQKTHRMLVAEDIWQVIRHQQWIDRGAKDDWTVDSRKPMQFSERPLPKIEVLDKV